MRAFFWIGLTFFALINTSVVQAKEHRLVLILDKIKAESLSEDRGDEVYLSVSKYSNKGAPEEVRVPDKPRYWQFRKLDSIKNIVLWQGKIASEESLRFDISVVEQDFPPWDIDDLIGTLRVIIQEEKDHLKIQWSIPKMDGQPQIDDLGPVREHGHHFVLHGENSKYQAVFLIQEG